MMIRRATMLPFVTALACSCASGGCRNREHSPIVRESAPDAQPASAPADLQLTLVPEPLGMKAVRDFDYLSGEAASEWRKVEEPLKASDWAAVVAVCEATLAKDPNHLAALRTLGAARTRLKELAGAVEAFSRALAADWIFGGPTLERQHAQLLAAPQGKQLLALNAHYRAEFMRRVKGGVLVAARRSGFEAPAPGEARLAPTRGELYAWDAESERYLRVTQTAGRLATWLVSPSGDAIAYLAWGRVEVPEAAAAATRPPMLAETWIGVVRLSAPDTRAREGVVRNARAVSLAWGAGDRLIVTTHAPDGRWGLTDPRSFSHDRETGTLQPAEPPAGSNASVTITYDEVERRFADPAGVEASFGEHQAAASFRLTATQRTITLPTGQPARRGTFVWSPSGTRLTFVTRADPCAGEKEDRLASLYVVDGATGALQPLARGASAMPPVWIDDARLAYEDDEGAVRVVHAADGRELARLVNPPGLSLLGLTAGPPGARACKATSGR